MPKLTVTTTVRWRLPWLLLLLDLAPWLPWPRAFAQAVIWCAWPEMRINNGPWQRIRIAVPLSDDDDTGGGTPLLSGAIAG